MEFMIAWFPALKLSIGAVFAVILYYLFNYRFYKVFSVVLILLVVFMGINPISYDGSKSIEASSENVRLVDEKVELAHEEHPIAVKNPEKSFDEQMAIQEAASDVRTTKLRKELGLE